MIKKTKLGYFGMAVPLALAITNGCSSSPDPDGSGGAASGGTLATGGQASGGAASGGQSSGGSSGDCDPIAAAYGLCELGGMGGMGGDGGMGGESP